MLNISLQPQNFKSLRQVVNNTVPTSYVRQLFEKAKKKKNTEQNKKMDLLSERLKIDRKIA